MYDKTTYITQVMSEGKWLDMRIDGVSRYDSPHAAYAALAYEFARWPSHARDRDNYRVRAEYPMPLPGRSELKDMPVGDRDRVMRWRPTAAAHRHAMALLEAEPLADMAVIPLVQPGKDEGVWTLGQTVETVPGVVFLAVNSFQVDDDCPVPSYSWARDAASKIAIAALGSRPGTVAWATIRRNGNASVFEDFLDTFED